MNLTYAMIRGELMIEIQEFPYWRKATDEERDYLQLTRNLQPPTNKNRG